ncbi:MAG: hypothetical protein JXA42_22790 [Anaerolineales bacterium]|nr:hypothetical protein [Anaerolineales bacterium]
MKKSYSTNRAIVISLALLTAVVVLSGVVWILDRVRPVQAAPDGKSQGGAEYNAINYWDKDIIYHLPFVISDPVWGWQTTAVVQNTSLSTTTVKVYTLDAAGNYVDNEQFDLEAMGSAVYTPTSVVSGSLLVVSDEDVVVMGKDTYLLDGQSSTDRLMSYRGTPDGSGGKEINLLPVYRNYEGWNSWLAIYNSDFVIASIDVYFHNQSGVVVLSQEDVIVPAKSTYFIDVASLSALGQDFMGRVRIESSAETVGVVKSINSVTGEALAHNNRALVDDEAALTMPNIYLPTVLKHSLSTLLVYNLDNAQTVFTATLYYTDGSVASTASETLEPYAMRVMDLNDAAWLPEIPQGFSGCGMVEFDYSSMIGVLVDTSWAPGNDFGTGYSGVWLDLANTFYVPFLRRDADGLSTNFNIQNINNEPITVTVSYYDQEGNLQGTADQITIDPMGMHTCDQGAGDLPKPFRGSAVVQSLNSKIMAVTGRIWITTPEYKVYLPLVIR